MSDSAEPDGAEPDEPEAPRAAGRRVSTERLREVFGEVLPETTSDERDATPPESSGRDEWIQENRPPHH